MFLSSVFLLTYDFAIVLATLVYARRFISFIRELTPMQSDDVASKICVFEERPSLPVQPASFLKPTPYHVNPSLVHPL